MDEFVDQRLLIQTALESVRKEYEPLWSDCGRFTCPRRSDIKTDSKGKKKGTDIYNGAGIHALNLWSDGLQGHHVSQAIKWFAYTHSNPDLAENDDVRAWLQDCTEHIYSVFRRSGTFYSAIGPFIRDGGAMGNAAMFIEENLATGKLVFIVPTIRQCYFTVDKFGNVDQFHRKFKLTLRQIHKAFGSSELTIPMQVDIQQKKNWESEYSILHCSFANKNYIAGNLTFRGARFNECYILVDSKKLLARTPLDVFNPVVWRVRPISGEPYAYGPASDALSDILQSQQTTKSNARAQQLMAEPPLNVPAEQKDKVDFRPRGENYYSDAGKLITPIVPSLDYRAGLDRENKLEEAIEKHFRVSFFTYLRDRQKQQGQPVTATEIIHREGKEAIILGPVTGSLSDALDRIHDRVFDIELRAGRLPQPPDIIFEEEGRIDVDYIGPLAQAQKRLFKTQDMSLALQEWGLNVAPIFPESKDKIKGDKITELLFEGHGVPQEIIANDDEVAEIRRIRAERQQLLQAAELAAGAADAVPKLQKATEEGAPLDQLQEAIA